MVEDEDLAHLLVANIQLLVASVAEVLRPPEKVRFLDGFILGHLRPVPTRPYCVDYRLREVAVLHSELVLAVRVESGLNYYFLLVFLLPGAEQPLLNW